MADINLERKDATMWPWVVGLLALALVIWGVWAATDGRNGEMAFDEGDGIAMTEEDWQQDEQRAEAPQSVRDFLNECSTGVAPGAPAQTTQPGQNGEPAQPGQTGQQGATGQTQQDQTDPAQYAESCIDQMITAMEDVARDDDQLQSELDRLRQRADALGEEDSESPQYSVHVQEILTSAATFLQQIQQTRPGVQQAGTEVEEARRAADEIQPDVPIAQQTQELSRFFQRAGTAMQMMGE